MLLRISLIIALVAGLLAAAVGHLKVKPKIDELTTNLTDTTARLESTQKSEAKYRSEANKLKGELDDANKALEVTTNELIRVTAKAVEQEKRANRLAGELETTTEQRNTAQIELAAWRALGLSPNQISNLVDSLKKATNQLFVFAEENSVLLRNNKKLQTELDKYVKPDVDPPMRQGLKGKVVAVNTKWDFVVLDVGAEQGALERGVLLVNRSGKLVGKVRISTIEPNRSIANIMPEWRQEDIQVGDQVLY